MNSQVSIVRCRSYDPCLILEATRKAIDLIGGIANYIKPEKRVLIKPNLLMAKEPEFGITTHPEVVRAIAKIFIGDAPNVWGGQIENIDEVYERSGVKRIAEEEGIEIVKFDKRRWRGELALTTWLDDCDYHISIPKFKTHALTILTGAIKNLFGLVPGNYKLELHRRNFQKEDFANMLVDIYEEAKPALTVVDGIVAMEGEGPSGGKLRDIGLLFASSDCVALDSVLATIMGLKPYDILTNKEAAQRRLGTTDINSIQILGEKLEDVIGEPIQLPPALLQRNIPRPIIKIAKKLIRFYPKVNHNNCNRCGACIKACPEKIIGMKNGRIIISYSSCISCFCCQEACPNRAISIKRNLIANLLRL